MSVRVIHLVFTESQATGTARLVLLALADVASDTGEVSAYARSQSILAAKAKCHERSVRRSIEELQELGEVVVTKVGNGRERTDYQITLPSLEGGRGAPPARATDPPREGEVPPQGGQETPSITPPPSVAEPSPSEPLAPSTEIAVVERAKAPAKQRERDVVFDAIASACGINEITRAMGSSIGEAKRDISEAMPDLYPDELAAEIANRAAVHRRRFKWDMTPRSLAKYWGNCAPDEVNMRAVYASMTPMERMRVRADLAEKGMTDDEIKEIIE